MTNCCISLTMSKIYNQIRKLDVFGKVLVKTKSQKITNCFLLLEYINTN